MNISDQLKNHLFDIIDVARLAPSVHNSQPWVVTTDGDQLTVEINSQYQLGDGDPTGRETMISMGIFCEAIAIAAGGFGLEVTGTELADGSAILSFRQLASPRDNHLPLKLLRTRCTDRTIYSPTAISDEVIANLKACNTEGMTSVYTSTDQKIIEQVAILTSKAINLALSSPGFRHELSQYLIVQGSKKLRGIAVGSLYINPLIARLQPFMLRYGINLSAEAKLEKQRWLSASGLVLITAPGDVPNYWLEVGRTYLHVSLLLEQAGLSQATSAAIVEASNYHEDVEESLGTSERILAVIRFGKGSQKRHYTPRVDAESLIG